MNIEYPRRESIEFTLIGPGTLKFRGEGDFSVEELVYALEAVKNRLMEQTKAKPESEGSEGKREG